MTTPREQLADIVSEHMLDIYGRCMCGTLLPRGWGWSEARLHLADAIIAAGWTPPPPATLDPATEN